MRINSIDSLRIETTATLEDLISVIQSSGALACALAFKGEDFHNLLTDGDIRRAILKKKTLNLSVSDVLEVKKSTSRPNAISVLKTAQRPEIKALFKKHNLRQLLITDEYGTPDAVIHYKDINYLPQGLKKSISVLIMAGGFGTRLLPLTKNVPKPMLLVNGVPTLELIVRRIAHLSPRKVYISLHYLPEKITDHFGDGSSFGLDIQYLHEASPMGTGGCLKKIKALDEDLLVVNGDVVSLIDYEMFYGSHLRNNAAITIAVTQYNFVVPYGVIQEENMRITSLVEKPSFNFLVNSGIYFINPSVLNCLPEGLAFNMTDVIEKQVNRAAKVCCFPVFEKWIDIGQPADLALANRDNGLGE